MKQLLKEAKKKKGGKGAIKGLQREIHGNALYHDDRAKTHQKITEENPGTALMGGNHVKAYAHKLRARKQAFRGSHPFQSAIPFRGMGTDGEKKLKKLRKNAFLRFTEGGKKDLRGEAKARDASASRRMSNMKDNPATSHLSGATLAGVHDKLRARKAAFTADHPAQGYIPFRGMGSDGEKSLSKLKRKKKSKK